MKIKVLTTLFALLSLLLVGLSPAQAAESQNHLAPVCDKKWFGAKVDCTRAEAWREATSLTNKALRQNNNQQRSKEMKSAILKITGPALGKTKKGNMKSLEKKVSSTIGDIIKETDYNLTLKKGLCVQKSLQAYVNETTKKTKLANDYYKYLKFIFPKKIKNLSVKGYRDILIGSKATVTKIGEVQIVNNLLYASIACNSPR